MAAAAEPPSRAERLEKMNAMMTTIVVHPTLQKFIEKTNQEAKDRFDGKYNILCRESMGIEARWTNASALHTDPKYGVLVFDTKDQAVRWIKTKGTKGYAYYILYENTMKYSVSKYVPEVWTASNTNQWHITEYHIKAYAQKKQYNQRAKRL